MVQQLTAEKLRENAVIHTTIPVRDRTVVDRTFELPARLHGATVALYLGFIATMAVGFASPGMILPVVIFTVIIVAGFGVPALWTGLNPPTQSRAMAWEKFAREGVMTAFGRTSARDATVQVIILPALIFLWGAVTVTIAALVR